MAKIKFRYTPFIKEILGIYDEERAAVKMDASLILNEASNQGWFYTFGITHKECFIDGLDYPQAGGLSDICRETLKGNSSEEVKKNCDYFNFVYNTCYQYITDNQIRYFGRANLNDISHGKVFAMTLIAHLCQRAITLPLVEQGKLRERIQQVTIQLLQNKQIQETYNNDDTVLSCVSALNRIYTANSEKPTDKKNEIETLFSKIETTIQTAKATLSSTDGYTLPLLSEQATICAEDLDILLSREADSLSSTERGLLQKKLIQEIYGKRKEKYKEEQGYKELYNGVHYELDGQIAKESFLLSQFKSPQKVNLKKLLQCRDRLEVLTKELEALYSFTQNDKIAYFNEFLHLLDPYLKEIHRVKGELHACVEQFNTDCSAVYRSCRSKNNFLNRAARKNWEPFYFNKGFLEKFRQNIATLSHDIGVAFSSIPFDHFNALQVLSEIAKKVMERCVALFGEHFTARGSKFQRVIAEAQKTELNRQVELILVKQKDISAEYKELIAKAKESKDENAHTLVELLERRQKIVDEMIDAMCQQSKTLSNEDNEGFFLIEQGDVDSQLVETEHQTNGFFQFVRNYLASPSAIQFKGLEGQVVQLNEELINAKKENERLKANQSPLEQANLHLQHEGQQKQEQIDDLVRTNQKMANALTVTAMRLLTEDNSRLLVDAMNAETCTANNAKQLAVILTNFKAIIDQGKNYEEAYRNNSGSFDYSLFFSHNNNGKNHARKVRSEWENTLQNKLNHYFSTANKPLLIDDHFIKQLADTFAVEIRDSTNQVINNEDYSSYKKHSFRNYLRYFHKQLINDNNKLKIDLTMENAVVSVGVDQVFTTVNGEEFKAADLRCFEANLKEKCLLSEVNSEYVVYV